MADAVQTEGAGTGGAARADTGGRMQTLLASFRQIGVPLMRALVEAPAVGEGAAAKAGLDTTIFTALIDSTVLLSRELVTHLDGGEDGLDPGVRWAVAASASQIVAAGFRANGRAMQAEDAARIAELATAFQEKFKMQLPVGGEALPNTVATFRARMMEAMVPVIGAVAQYAFGRAEHALLSEVAEKLVRNADQITRALAPAGATPEQWRLLCWHILRASGQIYTECHYAEADRLVYMSPDDRAAYFAKHGNAPPMTQIWQAFNQRMAMLATLATYLDVPASAHLDAEGWA